MVLLVWGDAADLHLIGTAGLRGVCAITALLRGGLGGAARDVSGVVQGVGSLMLAGVQDGCAIGGRFWCGVRFGVR